MPIIIAIQPYFVGIDDRVIVLHRYGLRVARVSLLLFWATQNHRLKQPEKVNSHCFIINSVL